MKQCDCCGADIRVGDGYFEIKNDHVHYELCNVECLLKNTVLISKDFDEFKYYMDSLYTRVNYGD